MSMETRTASMEEQLSLLLDEMDQRSEQLQQLAQRQSALTVLYTDLMRPTSI